MKICLVTVGSFKSEEFGELVSHYLKLAGKFASIEHAELKLARGVPEDEAQNVALEKFLEKRGSRAYLTVLDERGTQFTSRELAARVEKIKDGSFSEWIIAVGGAHGYGDRLRSRAQLLLSLSKLTMAHELATTVLAEQLFRALSILNRHPYHND